MQLRSHFMHEMKPDTQCHNTSVSIYSATNFLAFAEISLIDTLISIWTQIGIPARKSRVHQVREEGKLLKLNKTYLQILFVKSPTICICVSSLPLFIT